MHPTSYDMTYFLNSHNTLHPLKRTHLLIKFLHHLLPIGGLGDLQQPVLDLLGLDLLKLLFLSSLLTTAGLPLQALLLLLLLLLKLFLLKGKIMND